VGLYNVYSTNTTVLTTTRYVRMRNTGAVMEARFDRAKHTQHCRKLALKKNANPDLLIEVEVSPLQQHVPTSLH
jgi:hypothetical protein